MGHCLLQLLESLRPYHLVLREPERRYEPWVSGDLSRHIFVPLVPVIPVPRYATNGRAAHELPADRLDRRDHPRIHGRQRPERHEAQQADVDDLVKGVAVRGSVARPSVPQLALIVEVLLDPGGHLIGRGVVSLGEL